MIENIHGAINFEGYDKVILVFAIPPDKNCCRKAKAVAAETQLCGSRFML